MFNDNCGNRVLDFLYDSSFVLPPPERKKAEKLAYMKLLSSNSKPSSASSNGGLNDVLRILPIFPLQTQNSIDKSPINQYQSVVVQGRHKPEYISSVNRYKFYSAPVINGKYREPFANTTTTVGSSVNSSSIVQDEKQSPKSEQEFASSLRSSSSGYQSKKNLTSTTANPNQTSTKVKAVVDRLYHGYPPNRYEYVGSDDCLYRRDCKCHAKEKSTSSAVLPSVKQKSVHSTGRARNYSSPDDNNEFSAKTPAIDVDLKGKLRQREKTISGHRRTKQMKNEEIDELRQKLAVQSDFLRYYVEDKLKRLRIRQELELKKLERERLARFPSEKIVSPFDSTNKNGNFHSNENFHSQMDDNLEPPLPPVFSKLEAAPNEESGELTRNIHQFEQQKTATSDDTDENDASIPFQKTTDDDEVGFSSSPELPVDEIVIQNDIITPFLNLVIGESIASVMTYKTNGEVGRLIKSQQKLKLS